MTSEREMSLDAVWISRATAQMSRVMEDCTVPEVGARDWKSPFADGGEVEQWYCKWVRGSRPDRVSAGMARRWHGWSMTTDMLVLCLQVDHVACCYLLISYTVPNLLSGYRVEWTLNTYLTRRNFVSCIAWGLVRILLFRLLWKSLCVLKSTGKPMTCKC